MFLSKIWLILVTLAAGLAWTLAVVAPRPAAQKIERLEGERLDRAQYAAEQMLRADAHLWIDTAAQLGRDAILSESLDSASRGVGELPVIHKTVQDRLRALVPQPAALGLLFIAGVDARGRVVARLGESEDDYKDGLAGAAVVGDALRGYLSDDVWGAGGRVARVAAAPVLSKGRDRIVGALMVGADAGARLADLWKKNLDVDVAVLLRGRVVASTMQQALIGVLPELVSQHQDEIAEAGRTRAIPVPAGGERLLVVAAPFRGAAGVQRAAYALIGKQPARADLVSLVSDTRRDDLKMDSFPWVILGGGLLAALAIGLGLQRVEIDGPLAKLRREMARLAAGDQAKIEDRGYGGKLGGIARDVNAVIDRLVHARPEGGPRSDTAGKDLNAILGGAAVSPPALPSPTLKTLLEPASPFGPQRAAPVPPAAAAPVPLPPWQPTRSARVPAPPSAVPPPLPAAVVPLPEAALEDAGDPDPPVRPPPFQPLPEDGSEAAPAAEETDVRELFTEYLAVKEQCGEPTSSMSLDKFRAKLETSQAALKAKYGCRTVRFLVYVKDGKAALKATPIKD